MRGNLCVLIGLAALSGFGCTTTCVEGSTQECACAGGRSGVQTCTSDGRFDLCDCLHDGDAGVPSGDSGSMMGTGESVTVMLDGAGGEVRLANATLTIPAGAIREPTRITVTEATAPTPDGYRAFSPLYRFEPEGLTFALPVTVSIRSRATARDVSLGTLFWSRPEGDGGAGWERLGGVPEGDRVMGEVRHFSLGFVADGVDYTETPDRSCVRTRVLDLRPMAPAGLGLFFAMDDCYGRPITDLVEPEIAIFEDGIMLSSEASFDLFEQRGLQVFVTLAIDVSSSTSPILSDVIAAARALVETLDDPIRGLRGRVHVAIQAFAGEAGAGGFVEPHTLDLDRILSRLDQLAGYTPTDAGSTNLHEAVTTGLARSAMAQAAFRERNRGGAFTTGYLVVFTDGSDTSRRVPLEGAITAIENSPDDVIGVGLRGADYDPAALRMLAGEHQVYDADSRVVLARDFRHVAARIAGQVQRTYLLGYCSPTRSGVHAAHVGLRAAETRLSGAAPEFNATGFTPGCTPEMFDPSLVCGVRDCGGFGCGACDDRVEACDTSASPTEPSFCAATCAARNLCSGEMITNNAGYEEVCSSSLVATRCEPFSVNTTIDSWNCGTCGRRCLCSDGACVGAEHISSGMSGACFVSTGGGVHCTGGGAAVGGADRRRPAPVIGLPPASQIDAGSRHACALLADGTVWCWGSNTVGELGHGRTDRLPVPAAEVRGLSDVTQITAGEGYTCGRIRDGSARCWGSNFYGQLGTGSTSESPTPAPTTVADLTDVVELAAGGGHTCARLVDGRVRCWGLNEVGQLGDGTTTRQVVPTDVPGITDAVEIAAGTAHTCARRSDLSVQCWGLNDYGQLGDGTTTHRSSPVPVDGLAGVVGLSLGDRHSCARLSDGAVRCWGQNSGGELGDGTSAPRASPTPVPGLGGVMDVAAGATHTCVLLMDGTARCWGSGELFTDSPQLTPITIP